MASPFWPDGPNDKGDMPLELCTSDQSHPVPSTSKQYPRQCPATGSKGAPTQRPKSTQGSQNRHVYNFSKVITVPKYRLIWSLESAKIIINSFEQEHDVLINMDHSSTYDVKFTMSGTKESVEHVEVVLNDLFDDFFCSNEEKRRVLRNNRLFRLADREVRDWVHKLNKLEILKKYFVQEDRDNLTIRANTVLTPKNIDPHDVTFYDLFKHSPILLQKIVEQGFVAPTPIQCEALPVVLRGENAIIIATTGTGKTLTYLLPALIHVDAKPLPRNHPSVLILAPTRELVDQIKNETAKYEFKGIKSINLHSGKHLEEEIKIILEENDIIIVTPRKLIQLASSGYLNEIYFSFIVFDEADMLLDIPELKLPIQKLLLEFKHPKQTVMISATWPTRSNWLARSYLVRPTEVMIGGALNVVESVLQITVVLLYDEKEALLMKLMRKLEGENVLIFCNSGKTVKKISLALYKLNIKCQSLHAYIEYQQRKVTLGQVLDGQCNVLVTTDLVSRGIDFKDFDIVINAEIPRKIHNYIYRVGRVGRAGKRSVAINLFTQRDKAYAKGLIEVLRRGQQNVPVALIDMAERFDWLGYSADAASYKGSLV